MNAPVSVGFISQGKIPKRRVLSAQAYEMKSDRHSGKVRICQARHSRTTENWTPLMEVRS